MHIKLDYQPPPPQTYYTKAVFIHEQSMTSLEGRNDCLDDCFQITQFPRCLLVNDKSIPCICVGVFSCQVERSNPHAGGSTITLCVKRWFDSQV